jgi:hypothetical protein
VTTAFVEPPSVQRSGDWWPGASVPLEREWALSHLVSRARLTCGSCLNSPGRRTNSPWPPGNWSSCATSCLSGFRANPVGSRGLHLPGRLTRWPPFRPMDREHCCFKGPYSREPPRSVQRKDRRGFASANSTGTRQVHLSCPPWQPKSSIDRPPRRAPATARRVCPGSPACRLSSSAAQQLGGWAARRLGGSTSPTVLAGAALGQRPTSRWSPRNPWGACPLPLGRCPRGRAPSRPRRARRRAP